MNINVLLVEDEHNLGETLSEYLELKGMDCKWVQSATEARSFFTKINPDVILMDIGLPDGDGRDLAREFRQQRKDFVLLFLSAQNDPNIRLEGLELGAEDYITKPFELRELMLRLERIVKTKQSLEAQPESLEHGKLKIWFKRYEVQDAAGEIIPLGQKECGILKLLYDRNNLVVSRDEIIDEIWGQDSFPSHRTVDNYIVKLRKWAETDPQSGLSISTVRGIGYRLDIKG